MRYKNMNLGRRLMLGQGLLAGFVLLVGGFGVVTIMSLQSIVEQTASVEARNMDLAGIVDSAAASIGAANRGMMLSGMMGDTGRIEVYARQVQAEQETLDKSLREIASLLYTQEGREIINEVRQQSARNQSASSELLSALRGQKYDEATRILNDKLRPVAEAMEEKSGAFLQLQRRLVQQRTGTARTRASTASVIMIVVLAVAALVAAITFRSMAKSSKSLQQICAEIAESARQVASASQQVGSASSSLAQGSSEQAASLEETSASTEEINSMTQKNAENASTAARETENADRLLVETNEKLGHMISSMKEINTSSEKISRIIRVIDEIAFQTNILALNAAVEAARAGEAGMGFAVVADEVRNLAQRCAQAAKDTSDLIEESIVRSQEGKNKLDDVAASVNRVVENASRIKVLANEVHMGSQEQARGIQQIARAVTQMQQVTQSTAASAEESAAAGEEMSAQAAQLNESVGRLSEMVGADSILIAGGKLHDARGAVAAAKPQAATRRESALHWPVRKARESFPLEGDFRDF